MKFKIGDKIRVTDTSGFGSRVHVGDIGTIININDEEVEFKINKIDLIQFTHVDDNDIELVSPKDHAYNNNKIILNPPATILFKDGKKYVAKCHPDDEFDEMIGLQVALLKSFGIKYVDLQEMLKNATYPKVKEKKAKTKMEEVDVKDGKSYTISKIIINGNELCIGTDNETCAKFWCEEPSRDYVPINWANFIPKSKRGCPRKSTTTTTTKRPVGRPKKVKAEEPKPKRPVGRPKKIQNQEIEAGDFVRIKANPISIGTCFTDYEYMMSNIHMVKRVNSKDVEVFREGNDSIYFFLPSELELVKKGDKHEK